ncbi:Retrovirus-related Pol polyprotein from transposon RE1 [Vitis vinifera]|uniref:Retrovirus-related Pol polyprotein from transposon RE1 n=1 Tax=Vitis vinifera TaxID=29760 RepID=A0A438K529_VITVI|nr:Retrovirus-related Pol polyprotein from transposon RE1 [Vitis vinifera]
MSSDKLESFPIRFTSKNYCAWEFQFKLFVKGKELWGHIDGSNPAPRDAEALSKWEMKDARVMTWILSSVEPHLVFNLRPYKTAPASTTLRWSTRLSRPPDWYGFFSPVSLVATLSTISIPSCYKQAMEHKCWKNAMQAELQAIEENHTWDIVPCPPIVKPIGSKWVFSIKLRFDGSLDRYKAHLVALGNKQEYEVDYEETFAPIAKMTTEEIYMKLPSSMTNSSPHDVCKLKRSLYGLKQAPRAWFKKFHSTILSFSFTQSQYDSSSSSTRLRWRKLHTTFHMKDLGQLTYFLGLEVHHRASGIFVNQHKYIQDLITLAGSEDTSFVDTPMEENVKYRKDEGDLLDDPTLFRRLFDASYAIFEVHLLVGYSFLLTLLFNLLPIVMLIGLGVQIHVDLLRVGVEYRAMSTACSKIVWLHDLLKELGFPYTTSTPLHADNTSAIQIATNPVLHEHTKHIEVSIPLRKIKRTNQSENVTKSSLKYMEIITVDNFDFWFMGFLNYQKTFNYLQQTISLVPNPVQKICETVVRLRLKSFETMKGKLILGPRILQIVGFKRVFKQFFSVEKKKKTFEGYFPRSFQTFVNYQKAFNKKSTEPIIY